MLLITGGAGFIGTHFILDWLAHSEEPVLNLDCLSHAVSPVGLRALHAQPRHSLVRGDINDRPLLDALLHRHQPRAVLHFAAESHVDRSLLGPELFVQTNVLGTCTLLEAARAYWIRLPEAQQQAFRFLHVSTDEVYGSLEPGAAAFTEAHGYQPNSPYSASKAASDHLVRAWHHSYGLPVLTTHCSNNYGPYQHAEKLIPRMIGRALAGQPLPIYGDGLQVRDWLHVRDHCAALRCVLQSGEIGHTYNIGGGNEMSNLALVHTLCGLLDRFSPRSDGQAYHAQISHVSDRAGHDRRYAMDSSKIARTLGWHARHGFASGLTDTVQWFLAHREALA